MHALWDGLLGQRYDAGDIQRRISEITGDAELVSQAGFGVTVDTTLDPAVWLAESREAALQSVYTPEVLEPIGVAMRAGGGELQTIDLSDQYLKNAGRVAQLRALQASYRLARLLQELVVA